MKIVDVKTYVLTTPLEEPFAFSMGWVRTRGTMVVEVVTDTGVSGWGESLCHGLQPPAIAQTIVQSALKPILLGQDPWDVEVLWERMYNLTRPFGKRAPYPMPSARSISPFGIALEKPRNNPFTNCWAEPIARRYNLMPQAFTAPNTSRTRRTPLPRPSATSATASAP